MTRSARVVVLITLFAVTLFSLPTLAQEDEEESGQTTTTTTMVVIEPAVTIAPLVVEPTTPDWTYRYMIPTGLVLAAVVILLTSIRYFTDVVRKRYRIIEE